MRENDKLCNWIGSAPDPRKPNETRCPNPRCGYSHSMSFVCHIAARDFQELWRCTRCGSEISKTKYETLVLKNTLYAIDNDQLKGA